MPSVGLFIIIGKHRHRKHFHQPWLYWEEAARLFIYETKIKEYVPLSLISDSMT